MSSEKHEVRVLDFVKLFSRVIHSKVLEHFRPKIMQCLVIKVIIHKSHGEQSLTEIEIWAGFELLGNGEI